MINVDENLKPEPFIKADKGYGSIDTILNYIFFGKGYLIASEGHMLLYSRVKMDDGDEYVLISKEQYKQARKASKGHIGLHFFIRDKEIAFADETTSPKIEEVSRRNMIDFGRVVAKLINFSKSRLGGTKSQALINKNYLWACLDAFGKDTTVKMLFGITPLDPMIIKPDFNENNAFSLLLGCGGAGDESVRGEYQKAREEFYKQFVKEEPETKKRKKK